MRPEPVEARGQPMEIGPVEIGPIAHGGHCVARHAGRVVFVRHALPGERVRLRLTDTSSARFWRADAVEILDVSPARVTPRCPVAGPGLCGGCDFQHVDLAEQRRLKTAVVREQLHRLAGLDWDGEVQDVPADGGSAGLGWRTRMRYRVDAGGRVGLRAHRSHRVVPLPVDGCPLAAPEVPDPRPYASAGVDEIRSVAAPSGFSVLVDGRLMDGSAELVEQAAGRGWRVSAAGFWQVHPAAADTLVAAVLNGLDPCAGERALDLYCGVGVFAGALADRGCRVIGVEQDWRAVSAAETNLREPPPRHPDGRAEFRVGRVERLLPRLPRRTDLVVLDPPRTGAGRPVMEETVRRRPRAIAYIACDPAALARDLAAAADAGYVLSRLDGYDLFPMTHHVECVAVLLPGSRSPKRPMAARDTPFTGVRPPLTGGRPPVERTLNL